MTRIGWRLVWLAALCVCGHCSYDPIPADPIPDNPALHPTLWLRMEEAPPTPDNILDSAAGHAVRCVNGVCPVATAGVQGHGQGFRFSGGEQLQVDWRSDLDGRMGYTVAVWARLDEVPAPYSCAFAQPNNTDSGDGDSFALCADASDTIYVYATSATQDPDATLTGSGARVELHDWHHLAATWDPAERLRLLYVDGLRVAEAGSPALEFDDRVLVVGADLVFSNGTGVDMFHWRGALDDLMFFPAALSTAEIQRLAAH